jgi:hypothetical protein
MMALPSNRGLQYAIYRYLGDIEILSLSLASLIDWPLGQPAQQEKCDFE